MDFSDPTRFKNILEKEKRQLPQHTKVNYLAHELTLRQDSTMLERPSHFSSRGMVESS